MKRILLLVAAAAIYAAPATAAPISFNITDLLRADPVDLAAALVDAKERDDAPAIQCYQGAADYNAANPKKKLILPKTFGPVSTFQAARDVVKGVENPSDFIPAELRKACGWLALDVEADALKVVPAATTFLGRILN